MPAADATYDIAARFGDFRLFRDEATTQRLAEDFFAFSPTRYGDISRFRAESAAIAREKRR